MLDTRGLQVGLLSAKPVAEEDLQAWRARQKILRRTKGKQEFGD